MSNYGYRNDYRCKRQLKMVKMLHVICSAFNNESALVHRHASKKPFKNHRTILLLEMNCKYSF
jgi:hypothetical protein